MTFIEQGESQHQTSYHKILSSLKMGCDGKYNNKKIITERKFIGRYVVINESDETRLTP